VLALASAAVLQVAAATTPGTTEEPLRCAGEPKTADARYHADARLLERPILWGP
jgi:hypothetical protein